MVLGNHTIVWLDAPGLLEERTLAGDDFATDKFQPATGGVLDFLTSFKASGWLFCIAYGPFLT
jgi:hypothetical protein